MSQNFRRCLLVPLAIILIGCYLIGLRAYQNRETKIEIPVTTLSPDADDNNYQSSLSDGETININTATKTEIMRLKGIGEVMAERIIAMRDNLGRFTSIDQLKNVKGIGDKAFNEIKDYITIE